jgi:hypothetical protein
MRLVAPFLNDEVAENPKPVAFVDKAIVNFDRLVNVIRLLVMLIHVAIRATSAEADD